VRQTSYDVALLALDVTQEALGVAEDSRLGNGLDLHIPLHALNASFSIVEGDWRFFSFIV